MSLFLFWLTRHWFQKVLKKVRRFYHLGHVEVFNIICNPLHYPSLPHPSCPLRLLLALCSPHLICTSILIHLYNLSQLPTNLQGLWLVYPTQLSNSPPQPPMIFLPSAVDCNCILHLACPCTKLIPAFFPSLIPILPFSILQWIIKTFLGNAYCNHILVKMERRIRNWRRGIWSRIWCVHQFFCIFSWVFFWAWWRWRWLSDS